MEGYPIYEHDGGNWKNFSIHFGLFGVGQTLAPFCRSPIHSWDVFRFSFWGGNRSLWSHSRALQERRKSLFFAMEVSGFGRWWFNFSQQVWKTMGKYGKQRDIWLYLTMNIIWLVVWNMNGLWLFRLFINIGMSSSQLTNSIIFQRGRSTTNQINFSQLCKMLEDDKCARNVCVCSEGRCRWLVHNSIMTSYNYDVLWKMLQLLL